jgi:hypothetical protein
MRETTALGAAIAAGLAAGIWKSPEEMKAKISGSAKFGMEFKPQMDPAIVQKKFYHWNRAVDRSLGWVESEERIKQTESLLWKNLPSFVFGAAIGAVVAIGLMKSLPR